MGQFDIATVIDGAGFQISTILICISCLYYALIRHRHKRLQNMLFVMMLLNVCITALCNLITAMIKPVITGPGFLFDVLVLMQYIYFIVHPLLAPIFCFYVAIITGANKRLKRSHRNFYQAPMYATTLLAIINPLTHWIYYYTENCQYHRSWGVGVLYVVSMIYFLAAVVILFFFWSAVTPRIRQVLVFFFVLVAIGTVIQMLISGVHTELVCQALALTAVMIVVENEDTRRDQRTDILNHTAWMQDLQRALKAGQPFSIICIKMQNPLSLMQIIGQANIERLTIMTSGFLKSVGDSESLYYVGPGTFVLLRDSADEEKDLELARKIRARFLEPWDFQGRNNTFDAAVLFAKIPEDLHGVEDIMMLLSAPVPKGYGSGEDLCKGSGLDYIIRQSRLEKSILGGLKNQCFEVYYQPIYSSQTMNICSGEALLRFHDEKLGDIYPGEFLPVAERGGLIFDLGDFVIEEVCKFLNSGIPVEMGIENLHINLSVVQCIQQNYASHIIEIVSRYTIDPSQIVFEIMESAAATDFKALMEFMGTLREYGFSFSVNDYGIGYSNIHSIFHLDIDSVKIDKSILREAETSETGRIILESSIQMIRRMGKKIIISGVENQAQVDMANAFSINYMQGFFFSNPVSQNEFINVLKASRLARIEEQKAIASNEAMSSFLANMSHEIRTPINAVLGMDEMILKESKNDKVLGYAKTIESAGKTLLSLINDILDFSKIESGKMDILNHEYDLASVLLDVTAMIRMKAAEKDLALELDADPALPCHLMGDEVRLRQVLLNLLGNAVKYTKNGSVQLKVRGTFEGDQVQLKLSVKDTGIGIKPEDQEKLFEKFNRLDMAQNKTIEGTGLGLAITRQIITLMNGDISVESVYGKGSTFTVTLPQKVVGGEKLGDLSKRQVYGDKDKETQRPFYAGDAKILLVDDTPVNHIVVRELLSSTGIQIDEASSGEECLEMVAKTRYDLILLDFRMPKMDGIETLHAMKEMEGNLSSGVPVIALTANAIFGARERFIQEGFHDYITKPVSGKRLEQVMLSYLPPDKIRWVEEAPDTKEEAVQAKGLEQYGVDEEAGIKYCGSRESFHKVLEVFVKDISVKSGYLKEAYVSEDWERYGIEAHAIKSSARIVGAQQLSDLALKLETAAEEQDISTITENHESFLSQYEGMQNLLQVTDTEKEQKKALPEEEFTEAMALLKEYCYQMDADNAEMILTSLQDYELDAKKQGVVKQLEGYLSQLEWDRMEKELEDKV
ncbi:MAG: EAL domain-containing protein [Lachnospiraceae bacterium]|nr:EAL domain-containing protein [Lachnospiraceae bacterium]